ncbi:uncharacterized protein LAESUDRAFT_816090 [Laetiporus sulphureus 93-53]|uniref:Uncharacterized protein n=1 Tax=Laetiporus sulphureus 93-53 TaxID=1314785 RepID=A0A165BJN1_9APHY|nr:uncharacterized protein LAESUDRAFT_816090 [Laetiporus sulphureus 93-53]KZT01184.1 hypothetical protein LAESUDRAFT_816090 [Laetiporus sulphureus 93-53]
MPALLLAAGRTLNRATSPQHTASVERSKRDSELAQPTAQGPALKDRRAYEHERQRAKKTVEVERARERKQRKSVQRLASDGACLVCRTAHTRRSGVKGGVWGVSEVEGQENAPLEPRDEQSGSLDIDDGVIAHVRGVREVDLASLIKPAKTRKPKAEDYEVIPNVRPVIALDDRASAVPEVDEPWEHISAEDEDGAPAGPSGPSYAQIVANMT